jgi:hypothetical protein
MQREEANLHLFEHGQPGQKSEFPVGRAAQFPVRAFTPAARKNNQTAFLEGV